MANLKSLAKDTAIYGLSSIIGRFLNYLLVPLYTAKISAASGGYGVITNMYAYTALLLVILTYGMETTFFRFVNKEGENSEKVYHTVLSMVGFTSLLFIALVFLFITPLSDAMGYADHPAYVWTMFVTVAIDAFQCIPFAYLRYKKRPLKFAAFKLLFIGLNIALNLVYYVIMDGHDVGYAFYINLVCTASITFCFYKELKEGFMGEKCSWSECKVLVRKMMGYSWPILVLGIAGILNQTADKILFPYIYEKGDAHAQLGIYGAASKIAMIMAMITQAFRYAYEPFVFGKAKDKDNPTDLRFGDEIFRYLHPARLPGSSRLSGCIAPHHRSRLLGWFEGSAYRNGCRNHDGSIFQPQFLVQAHRQDHLGCLLLRHRLCGIDCHQRYLRTSLWLHCLCLGWFCWIWNSHASLLLCRSEEVSYQLSGEGDYDLCGSRPHPLRRNDRG